MRVDDGVRGYFDDNEFDELRTAIHQNIGKVHEFKDGEGRTYRKTRISEELPLLVDFMVETYIQPTDVKVLKHEDVRLVEKAGITFVVLEHEKTKLHKKNMVSTERGLIVYGNIGNQKRNGTVEGSDYLFLPELTNRDTALQNLSSQFAAILHMAGMTGIGMGNLARFIASAIRPSSDRYAKAYRSSWWRRTRAPVRT